MPTLMELRSRLPEQQDSRGTFAGSDESLVADKRGRLTPAQIVELKLRGVLAKSKAPDMESNFRAYGTA